MQQGQADMTEKCIACGREEHTTCDRWDCPFLLEKEDGSVVYKDLKVTGITDSTQGDNKQKDVWVWEFKQPIK